MTSQTIQSRQHLKADTVAASARLIERYEPRQVPLNTRPTAAPPPSTEEESDRWVAQQLFALYND